MGTEATQCGKSGTRTVTSMSFTNEEYLAELEKRLSELPESGQRPRCKWTQELDALLLKYWIVKRKADVAKVLGRGEIVCRQRYEELTRDKKE